MDKRDKLIIIERKRYINKKETKILTMFHYGLRKEEFDEVYTYKGGIRTTEYIKSLAVNNGRFYSQ